LSDDEGERPDEDAEGVAFSKYLLYSAIIFIKVLKGRTSSSG
jgi:hypothetical protein